MTLVPNFNKERQEGLVKTLKKYEENKKGTKSARAGLILPVARIHTMLKNHKVGSSVSPLAAVLVAKIVEDEIVKVLENANKDRKEDDKFKRVSPHNIKEAITSEMTHLQGDMKRGGVHEHIEESLVPKKRKRSEEAPATKRAKKAPATKRAKK